MTEIGGQSSCEECLGRGDEDRWPNALTKLYYCDGCGRVAWREYRRSSSLRALNADTHGEPEQRLISQKRSELAIDSNG